MIHLQNRSRELTGLPGEDEWTAWQFNNAVTLFGIHLDNKLNEVDKKGKPKYKLKDLLADKKETQRNLHKAMLDAGLGEIID